MYILRECGCFTLQQALCLPHCCVNFLYCVTIFCFAQATADGSSFYWAGSGTGTGGGTYTIEYAPWGITGDATASPAVPVFSAQGGKFVDFNPYDGRLYATAQTPT